MPMPWTTLWRTAAAAALCLGFALAAPALAQDPSCKADVEKFCGSTQDRGKIAECLQKHQRELSPSCVQRLTNLKQDLRAVGEACEQDIHTHCSGVQPGGGRIGACLKKNQDTLSPQCKAKLADATKRN